MISDTHKTIFVHIPKVAGQSIETIFLKDLGLGWEDRHELLLRIKKKGEEGPHRLAHLRAKDYVAMHYINAERFETYFKFSFVRNPYNRVLSLYNYLGYNRIISVTKFIDKVLSRSVKGNHFFFQSQYDYLYDNHGKLLVDYVGKLEDISKDIEYVLDRTGLHGVSLPHVNKSEKGLKRGLTTLIKNPAFLTDLRIKNLISKERVKELNEKEKQSIYELYTKDFEMFGYEK